MKKRLTLTIDESLLNDVRLYAKKQKADVTQLVKNYLENISKRKTTIDLVEDLSPDSIDHHLI